MIYEYALDPALLDNWKDFRFFRDSFDIDQGRLISDYPRRWHRAVLEVIRQADCGDVEKKRIKEALRRIQRPTLHQRQNPEWNKELGWLDNACIEHKKHPFHAIVFKGTVDDPLINDNILCGDDLDDTKAAWASENTAIVTRNAADMATPACSLLALAQHVLFVDPHFDPGARRFNEPLIAFLQLITARNTGVPVQRIEYHSSDKIPEDYFTQMVDKWVKPRMPADMTISFVRWPQGDMHPRHIVTNIGSLTYENGLDTGTHPAEVRIYRDSRVGWEDLWQRYSKSTPFYSVSS